METSSGSSETLAGTSDQGPVKHNHKSLNKFMHPKNPYRHPPSFKKLASEYASFREHCTFSSDGRILFDFKNPLALRVLAVVLLERDFNLKVEIPENRLVPTLPLRMNYILWLQDLLNLSQNISKSEAAITGLDIGTGAAAVYPLLGTTKCGWFMIGSETDDFSYSCAVDNVLRNNLTDSIIIKKVSGNTFFKNLLEEKDVENFLTESKKKKIVRKESEFITSIIEMANEVKLKEKQNNNIVVKEDCDRSSSKKGSPNYILDFIMCNPPFFSCEADLDSVAKSKKERKEPSNGPTGAVHEKVVEGGEVAFISSMIQESLIYKEKIRIFTTLIGTKADVDIIEKKLADVTPAHITKTEFCQGRTMRWGIAWTFDPHIPLKNVFNKKQRLQVKPLILIIPRSRMTQFSVAATWRKITAWLLEVKIKPKVFTTNKYFVGANVKVYKALWLNQRRKKREQKLKEGKILTSDTEDCSLEDKTQQITSTMDVDVSVEKRNPKHDLDVEHPAKRQKIEDTIEDISYNLTEQNLGVKLDDTPVEEKMTGLECLLKFNLHVKHVQGQISIEFHLISGSLGKDGLNQLLVYIQNKLKGN